LPPSPGEGSNGQSIIISFRIQNRILVWMTKEKQMGGSLLAPRPSRRCNGGSTLAEPGSPPRSKNGKEEGSVTRRDMYGAPSARQPLSKHIRIGSPAAIFLFTIPSSNFSSCDQTLSASISSFESENLFPSAGSTTIGSIVQIDLNCRGSNIRSRISIQQQHNYRTVRYGTVRYRYRIIVPVFTTFKFMKSRRVARHLIKH
jgi:hypothetical protein